MILAVIEYADKVFARLDRLLDVELGPPRIVVGS